MQTKFFFLNMLATLIYSSLANWAISFTKIRTRDWKEIKNYF